MSGTNKVGQAKYAALSEVGGTGYASVNEVEVVSWEQNKSHGHPTHLQEGKIERGTSRQFKAADQPCEFNVHCVTTQLAKTFPYPIKHANSF